MYSVMAYNGGSRTKMMRVNFFLDFYELNIFLAHGSQTRNMARLLVCRLYPPGILDRQTSFLLVDKGRDLPTLSARPEAEASHRKYVRLSHH